MDNKDGAPDLAWFTGACREYGAALHGDTRQFERVETDSRSAGIDSLFVALKGERVDGHDFISSACDRGCKSFLVDAAWYGANKSLFGSGQSFITVSDPLSALQAAARAWCLACENAATARSGPIVKIGVTGSSGKTTAKELIANIMEAFKPTVRNPGNLNSEIGLPASIFLMRPRHEVAVFEMGINRVGEMEKLAEIFRPGYAVITNIGTAHIGLLGGSKQGIAEQKKLITGHFTGNGSLFVWEEDSLRDFLLEGIRGTGFTFGPRSTDGFEGARSAGLDGWLVQYKGLEIRFALPGAHNLLDALAAISITTHCGATPEAVKAGLEKASALFGRSEIIRGAITVVNDCYNANAESVVAAIGFCDEVETAGRKIYVLGSMKELGAEAKKAHEKVGFAAARSDAALVMFYGEEARWAYEAAVGAPDAAGERFFHTYDYAELSRELGSRAAHGDLVLIKGSRSLSLERLAQEISGKGADHVS